MVRLYGGIDILINNAGILRVAPALETSDELFDEVVANNLRRVLLFSAAVARQMVRSGSDGRIVNMSSIHAVVSEPNASAYTAAKGGIEGADPPSCSLPTGSNCGWRRLSRL